MQFKIIGKIENQETASNEHIPMTTKTNHQLVICVNNADCPVSLAYFIPVSLPESIEDAVIKAA